MIKLLFILLYIFSISGLLANDWELKIHIENTYNDTIPGDYIIMGVCDGCIDGFQYTEDYYDLPDGPLDYTDIQFTNFDWLGNECQSPYFFSDYKSIHPPTDLATWAITGDCADAVEESTQTTQLTWLVDTLSLDYKIFIQTSDEVWNMRDTTSIDVNCEELHSNYVQIDGEWVVTSNIKVLMGLQDGDLNQDGNIDIYDVIQIVNIILYYENYYLFADLNEDDNIDIFDVLELVNIILDGDSGDIFDVMEIIKRV